MSAMAFSLLVSMARGGGKMNALKRCLDYLERAGIPYSHSTHAPAFTAAEVAAADRLPARNMAKTVVYRGDNGYGILLLRADYLIDFAEVLKLLSLKEIHLAAEAELANLFPDSELGAMPPVGNPVELPVLIDEGLADSEFVAFNAGTHRDVIHVSFEDFVAVVNPLIARFAVPISTLAAV
jgi:Ala-tRNA(Pro) deacylase